MELTAINLLICSDCEITCPIRPAFLPAHQFLLSEWGRYKEVDNMQMELFLVVPLVNADCYETVVNIVYGEEMQP
jgi:hypothetical protein